MIVVFSLGATIWLCCYTAPMRSSIIHHYGLRSEIVYSARPPSKNLASSGETKNSQILNRAAVQLVWVTTNVCTAKGRHTAYGPAGHPLRARNNLEGAGHRLRRAGGAMRPGGAAAAGPKTIQRKNTRQPAGNFLFHAGGLFISAHPGGKTRPDDANAYKKVICTHYPLPP